MGAIHERDSSLILRLRWPANVCATICLLILVSAPTLAQQPANAGAPPSTPSPATPSASDQSHFAVLDNVVKDAIAKGETPGAVLLVGHNGAVVYRKAFGKLTAAADSGPMTPDTIFDLASLTKVIVTTTCVMRLEQLGQIKLNDPVAKYIPDFAQNGKEDITIRMLLTHYSGLPADLDLKESWNGTEEGYSRVNAAKLVNAPGSTFVYSDVGFVVLGELVQKVTGMPLDQYAQTYIFGPLSMTNTRFNPPQAWMPRIAPTQRDEHTGITLRGTVHDPTARQMGGVAGDAGVFSTADDVAKFAQAILNGGGGILSALSVEKMTTPQQPANMPSVRGLGWDIDSPFSSNRGELLPVGSFGHTGFTGTSLWIDPTTNTYIILLTNSLQLKTGNVIALRTEVADAVAAALQLNPSQEQKLRISRITGYNETQVAARRVVVRNGKVLNGIDVLQERQFEPLKVPNVATPRVGIVTNQTGIDGKGRRTIDVLARASGIQLTAIFAPEHGLQVNDAPLAAGAKDGATNVPVYPVWGDTDAKRRPSLDVLRNVDVIVYDLQDTGARFSSYTATLGYFLEAAAKLKKRIVVLDRPNLLNGAYVQGPVSDAQESPTNYFPLAVRHGMTTGELAGLFNSEKHFNADLVVVPMRGWLRGDWFDSTGSIWANPAPDVRNLDQAALYPGVALVESTNISVGRGTDMPYQLVGSPYFIPRELASYLNGRNIGGVRFIPTSFTPTAGPFARRECFGVQILVTNRELLDSAGLGLELAAALHKLSPLGFDMAKMNQLLVNKVDATALQAGEDPNRILENDRDKLDQFMVLRAKYLLY